VETNPGVAMGTDTEGAAWAGVVAQTSP
jgi:hypothetical protein